MYDFFRPEPRQGNGQKRLSKSVVGAFRRGGHGILIARWRRYVTRGRRGMEGARGATDGCGEPSLPL